MDSKCWNRMACLLIRLRESDCIMPHPGCVFTLRLLTGCVFRMCLVTGCVFTLRLVTGCVFRMCLVTGCVFTLGLLTGCVFRMCLVTACFYD
jgi:hypothetical protein